MKLLLDENLPHTLRHEIVGHEVVTAAFMGWSGVENGALLALAAAAGFDAIITNDRGMEHERNPATLPLTVIVLLVPTNKIESIRPLLPKLQQVLLNLPPKQLVKIG